MSALYTANISCQGRYREKGPAASVGCSDQIDDAFGQVNFRASYKAAHCTVPLLGPAFSKRRAERRRATERLPGEQVP